ncbi:MAG TPA: nickel pincer cofactor biosynthesis protein LarB [Acidobacteriota bacterium]|nr:nickel pincer cofactor biosynthesis protein LarB [Acidobacteriota bacterium]
MNPDDLKRALRDFKQGEISEERLMELLRDLPYEDLGYAKIDHHRSLRHGFPEVVFGQGKTDEQIISIARRALERHPNLLITRTSSEVAQALASDFPCEFHQLSRAVTVIRDLPGNGRGQIGVFSAGTADIPVAEEAAVTARIMGNQVECCYDVGVAGLHRILSQRETLRRCSVVIVVAGMEGALPSVVGGLVDIPVIAVPTSVGYGASFGGLAALLGMLNSCASNVTAVNIDNGFGAGYSAALINRRRSFDDLEAPDR